MKRRGLSLAETVMAIFLFAGGGLACFELALSACRSGARVQRVTEATLIGETALDRIRDWAYSPDNYLNNWAIYDNQSFAWGDPPGYTVHTFVAADQRNPISPCSTLTVGHPQPALTGSTRLVRAEVRWGQGSQNERVSLAALIGEPARNPRSSNPLVITRQAPLVDPLPQDVTTRMSATLYDNSDRPIEGVVIKWTLAPDWNSGPPGGGMGTIVALPGDALGSQVDLLHHFYRGDPEAPEPPFHVPGWVVARASVKYDGVEIEANSGPIQLATP